MVTPPRRVPLAPLGAGERQVQVGDRPDVHGASAPAVVDSVTGQRGAYVGPGEIEDERVGPLLLADGRGRAVTRVDQRRVGQVQQLREDARHELVVIAPQVGPADRAGEQDVAAEDERRVVGRADEDDRAGAVPGNLADLEREARDLEHLAVVDQPVGGRAGDRDPERAAQVELGVAERGGLVPADDQGGVRDRPA